MHRTTPIHLPSDADAVPGGTEPDLDPELLAGFVAGDRGALRRVAEHYWRPMRRWAWLELRDEQLAEDAVQEALVRILRFHGRYDPRRPLGTWLRTIVRHAARDQRPMHRRVIDFVRTTLRSPEPTPDRQLELVRALDRVDAALEALSPRQRHLMDLCIRQNLSVQEAAAHLDITPSTARVHLHQARQRLKAKLGADFVTQLEEV